MAQAGEGLRDKRVVVGGAGEMGLGVSRALCDIPAASAPRSIVVVSRSVTRAEELKGRVVAIADGRNHASNRALEKIGLQLRATYELSGITINLRLTS